MVSLGKKMIALIVSLALFMDALDATIINTAIPAMAHSLHVNPVDLKIALISYLLSLATFIPISGWVADKYGSKKVFISALIIFTVSSFWCGYAQTLWQLVIARCIQGIGGAFMLPVGRLIILRAFPRHEFVDAMNLVVMIVSLGLMLGPFAGGMITDYFSWHWIFWVNLPFGTIAILIALFKLKSTAPVVVRPLDKVGFLLFGGGLATFTFALSELSESFANPITSWAILIVAMIMLISYFFRVSKACHPIFETELFQFRTFRIAMFGNLLARLGFGGIPFLLPLLLQVNLGYSARLSGLLLVPVAIGVFIVKAICLKFLRLLGYKRLLLINTLLISLLLLTFRQVNTQMPAYDIALLTFSYGVLIAMQFSAMNSLAYADLAPEDLSAATSIVSTVQQVAQSFGVAVAALLLRFFSTNTATSLTLTHPTFQHTFFALSVITSLSIFIFLPLRATDGHQMLKK